MSAIDDIFSTARRTLLTLLSPDKLKTTAIRFLEQGGESEEAWILAQCFIEYGDVRHQRGSNFEVDLTLRGHRKIVEKLRRASEFGEDPPLKKSLHNAIEASLPAGYAIANLETRAAIPELERAAKPAGNTGKQSQIFDYQRFTEPESLQKIGREVLNDLLAPHNGAFATNGVSLPDPKLEDGLYFRQLSTALRSEEKLPSEFKAKIDEMLQMAQLVRDEWQKEIEKDWNERHVVVPLYLRETGKTVLSSISNCTAVQHDHPERMTPEQSEVVAWLLDYFGEYLDMPDDASASQVLQCEREVSEKLDELAKVGLAIFGGEYRRRQVYRDGSNSVWRVAFFLVAAKDDPRIERDDEGRQYIKGVMPKAPKPQAEEKPPTDGKAATDTTEAKAKVTTVGRFEFFPGFETVRFDGAAYDLRNRKAARLCLEYLVQHNAYDEGSARPFEEIQKFVAARQAKKRKPQEPKIQHYFNGRIQKLGKQLIKCAGTKRYYLKVK